MRWLAYMPMRGGSRSIPGKNLRPIAGKPLFAWALGEALASGCFDEVWAGTDSAPIRDTVQRWFPGQVHLFERSPATCTDEASTESALLEFAGQYDFDVLCTIQATAPLTRAEDFRAARDKFIELGADSLLTATREKRFYWTDAAQPLNYDPARRPRRQDFSGTLVENGAFYLTRRSTLERAHCRLGGKIAIHEMAAECACEIDEPADWAVVEALLQRRRTHAVPHGIRGFVVDVDGTLTDGGMYYGPAGEIMKKFNTRDALGLQRLEQAGVRVAVITAENSEAVHARVRKLGIQHYFPGTRDKLIALRTLAAEWSLELREIAYMGDDHSDLECLAVAGYACCPADAVAAARIAANYVAGLEAGKGAVREVCEQLLAARG